MSADQAALAAEIRAFLADPYVCSCGPRGDALLRATAELLGGDDEDDGAPHWMVGQHVEWNPAEGELLPAVIAEMSADEQTALIMRADNLQSLVVETRFLRPVAAQTVETP